MGARTVIEKFGGQTMLAALLGKGQSTVAYWAKTGSIPARWHPELLALARRNSVNLRAEDFLPDPSETATTNVNKNNDLVVRMPSKGAASKQQSLDLGVQKLVEIDGVGMGVLSDGTPFLTGRGLARLCGITHSMIQDIANEWGESVTPPRVTKIREILVSHGLPVERPFIEIAQRSGVFNAYPDAVCLAVLEYYSFDAGSNVKDTAQKNYRLLAGKGLRDLIYTQVGYDPSNSLPDKWRQFHDRVSLTYNAVPKGYFGIFKEMADMIVTLGQAGIFIDSNFVPDISVGQHWARHWKEQNFDQVYGERCKFEHNYPNYFPQSASNPQEPWCYPEAALGEFRRWLREVYIGEGKFKGYVETKVREKQLPVSFAQLAIAAYTRD